MGPGGLRALRAYCNSQDRNHQQRGGHDYEVTASATPSDPGTPAVASLVIRLRGNETLIAEILRKTDWSSLLEHLK